MQFFKITFVLALVAAIMAGCGGAVNAKIGGTVTGLSTGTLILTNTSNGDTVSITNNANGQTTFTFPTSVAPNTPFNVTASTQPTGQVCSIVGGNGVTGSSGADITTIAVTCQAGSSVSVPITASVAGLANGATLTLVDVAAGTLTITGTASTAAGQTITQNFPNSLMGGQIYSISITNQPVFGPLCGIMTGTAGGTVQVPASGGTVTPPSPAVITCPAPT